MASGIVHDQGVEHGAGPTGNGQLSVHMAIRLAWVTWIALLVVPFFLFLSVVWTLTNHESARIATQQHSWFLASSAYLLVVVPASFFWRSRLFKCYWSGQPIPPAKYLFGMLAMWTALEFGGILSLLGCFVDRSLLPNLLPALIAFMFFVYLWPSGKSMVTVVGNAEDASVYEEPR